MRTEDIFKEAAKYNGQVKVFADKDLRSHIKNIRCPLHHCVIPGKIGFEIEPNPAAKNFTEDMCKMFKLKKWKYKRDKFGNKIPKWSEHYQPEISAAYAKERIYSITQPVCLGCRRCFQ